VNPAVSDTSEHAKTKALRLKELDRLSRLYEILLSTTDDFAYVFDTQGRFLYANTRLLKVYARTLDQVVGKTCYDLGYPTWHADMHMREIQDIVRTKQPIRGEVPFTGDSGIFGVYDYIFQPVLDSSGNVEVIVGTTRDVTERKKAEEKLESTLREKVAGEQRYRFLINSLPQITWTAKPDGRLDYYNQRWFDYSGTTPEKMPSLDLAGFVHPDDLESAAKIWQKSLESGCDYETELRLKRASDQTFRWHLVRAFPMKDENGAVLQWVGTGTDIDDQRQLTQKLVEAGDKISAVVESSDDAIMSKSLDGTIMSWNSGAQRIFGYTAEEIIGKSILLLIPSELQKEEPEIIARLKNGERIEHFETVRLTKDGRRVDISLTVSPIRDSSGKVVGASKIARDITEETKRLEALRESEVRFRTMADSAPMMIWEAGPDMLCNYFNQTWLDFVGRTPEQEMRNGWMESVHPEDLVRCEKVYVSSLESRRPFEMEYRLRHHSGNYRWILNKGVPRYGPNGTFQGYIGVCVDITESVQAKENLANSRKELERLVNERTASLQDAVAQMEEFSYSVSHDLRAPLRAMQGYASALLEDYRGKVLDSEAEDYLQRIVTAGLRMDRLTRDVLVYSKIPRTDLQLRVVGLDKLVSDIVAQYLQSKTQVAEITVETPLLPILGNESFMAQVVSNLVDNAVKFTASGRVPQVRIWTEALQGQVRLWVEDNGIGINPEHQKRIWGMFERVHPQTKFEGTGIGLAIVRKTVERMNGTMGVTSDGIAGSKFWVQLPGI
jgi:PAS domain S-box-containing protein